MSEWPQAKCADCEKMVDEIDLFPGKRCLECHAKIEDRKPPVSPDFTKIFNK